MTEFLSLTSCPFPRMSQVLKINRTEFIAVSSTEYSDGIYKYNANDDKWSKIISYDKELESTTPSAAFDQLNGLIYVCNKESQILQFNIQTKAMKTLLNNTIVREPMVGSSWTNMICINGILHILSTDNKHVILNENRSFNEIYEFDTNYYEFLANFIYLKSKKTMILFDAKAGKMYEYQIWNNEWTTHKLDSMQPLQDSAIVCTQNEQYLVTFGGWYGPLSGNSVDKRIFVFDMKKKIFAESKIKCPLGDSSYEVALIRDDYKDELITFGFVNQCYSSQEFSNLPKVPFYINKLINKWVCNEWIHLISWKNGQHWKISVDSIIQSI